MMHNSTSDSNATLSMQTHGTNISNVSTLDAIEEAHTIEVGSVIVWTVAFLCTVPIVALVASALDILRRKQIQMTTNPYYFVFFLLCELVCLLVMLMLSLLCIIGILSDEIILVTGVMCAAITMSSSMLLLIDRYMYMKRGIEYDRDTSLSRSKLIITIVFISCVVCGHVTLYTLDTPVCGFLLPLIILEIAFGCFNIIFNIKIYNISARSLTIQQELDFRKIRNKKMCVFLVNLLVTTCMLVGGGMVLTLKLYIFKINPTFSLNVKHMDSIYIILQIIIILWYTLIDKQWRMALKHKYQSMPCCIDNRIHPTDDVMGVSTIRIYPTDYVRTAHSRMHATDDAMRGIDKEIQGTNDVVEGAGRRIHTSDGVTRDAAKEIPLTGDVVGANRRIYPTDEVTGGAAKEIHLTGADRRVHFINDVMTGADRKIYPTDDVMRGADRKIYPTNDDMRRADRKIYPTDDVMEEADNVIHVTDDVTTGATKKIHQTDDAMRPDVKEIYPTDDTRRGAAKGIHPADDIMKAADRRIHFTDDVQKGADRNIHTNDDVMRGSATSHR